jgi:hypothetical protein
MENNILGIGKIIKCMGNKEDLNGLMEEFILVIMLKTKNMDMEKYNGQMGKFIKDNGKKVYNMEKEKLKMLMDFNIKGNGKMEKELNDQLCLSLDIRLTIII